MSAPSLLSANPATDVSADPADPADTAPVRRRRVGAVLIRIIGLYQALRSGRPSPCRYWPTCSAYAVDAIERHGAGRGTLLALRRVLRCHPWGGRGVDPVPE
jgi:putative membrane protein insertion efficiency factor